jgi:hypothetical protein
MRLIKEPGEWFDLRLQLGKPIKEAMQHPVPRSTASWAYVFGSASPNRDDFTIRHRHLSSHSCTFHPPTRPGPVCKC